MNRLWVRLSLMISGALLVVFFWQFGAILIDRGAGPAGASAARAGLGPRDPVEVPAREITRRLVEYAVLSLVVGAVGGIVIGRVVSAPVAALARATRRIGRGDLATRVVVRGSREICELARTFNRMAADLERAEAARRNLMADVSHELRTPLAVLEGTLQAALDDVYALDQAGVAGLHQQTRHLARLVEDLRELALAESHELPLAKRPVDLAELCDETLQTLEPLATEQGVRLVARAGELPRVEADPGRLRQVLLNLLANALRHTPDGGEVALTGSVAGAEVRLEVRDTGEGLDLAEIDRVFDRFYRVDRSRSRDTGGTGLGLAIVKGIVEAHGGRVEAWSPGKGKGSTFAVCLPIGTAGA